MRIVMKSRDGVESVSANLGSSSEKGKIRRPPVRDDDGLVGFEEDLAFWRFEFLNFAAKRNKRRGALELQLNGARTFLSAATRIIFGASACPDAAAVCQAAADRNVRAPLLALFSAPNSRR